jgi:HK97 family phage major capsid protein
METNSIGEVEFSESELQQPFLVDVALGRKNANVDLMRSIQKRQGARSCLQIPFGLLQDSRAKKSGQKRDMTASGGMGSGGSFVNTDVQPTVISALMNKMVTARCGVQVIGVSAKTGNLALPRETGPVLAQTIRETDPAASATPTLDQITMEPHRGTIFLTVSKQLLLEASFAEQWLRGMLLDRVAFLIDGMTLNGTGTGTQPCGILNQNGIGTITFGGQATHNTLTQFELGPSAMNANTRSMAWITTPQVRYRWRNLFETPAQLRFLWNDHWYDDDSDDGAVIGYRAAVTNQVLNNAVAFGNWADAVVIVWGSIDTTVDPYSLTQTGEVRFICHVFFDVCLRHPQSIVWSTDSGAQ